VPQQHAIAGDQAERCDRAGQREGVIKPAEQAHRQRPRDLSCAEGGRHDADRKRGRRAAAEPQRLPEAGHGDDHEGAADADSRNQQGRHVD
jgi:hypothetical protein